MLKAFSMVSIGTERHFNELQSSLPDTETIITEWFYLLWKMERMYSSKLLLKNKICLVSNTIKIKQFNG